MNRDELIDHLLHKQILSACGSGFPSNDYDQEKREYGRAMRSRIVDDITAIEDAGLAIVPREATVAGRDAGFLRNAELGGAKRCPEETWDAMVKEMAL